MENTETERDKERKRERRRRGREVVEGERTNRREVYEIYTARCNKSDVTPSRRSTTD